MSRNRFNWERPDSFERKFKRKPKLRTISEVHDLYIRAMQRSEKKSNETMKCIDEIIREIPTTPASNSRYNDLYITYFYVDYVLYQCQMRYEESYGSYGVSTDRVKFDEGSVEDIREKKINFLLNNQKALELGEKYIKTSAANKYLHYTVRHCFENMIITHLENKYKDIRTIDMPKAITISVGGKRYIFSIDNQSWGTYKKFLFLGESSEDIVLD